MCVKGGGEWDNNLSALLVEIEWTNYYFSIAIACCLFHKYLLLKIQEVIPLKKIHFSNKSISQQGMIWYDMILHYFFRLKKRGKKYIKWEKNLFLDNIWSFYLVNDSATNLANYPRALLFKFELYIFGNILLSLVLILYFTCHTIG